MVKITFEHICSFRLIWLNCRCTLRHSFGIFSILCNILSALWLRFYLLFHVCLFSIILLHLYVLRSVDLGLGNFIILWSLKSLGSFLLLALFWLALLGLAGVCHLSSWSLWPSWGSWVLGDYISILYVLIGLGLLLWWQFKVILFHFNVFIILLDFWFLHNILSTWVWNPFC